MLDTLIIKAKSDLQSSVFITDVKSQIFLDSYQTLHNITMSHHVEELHSSSKKFKMVALDLDGTLLNSYHTLSDETVTHLRKLHKRGFIICIATGRSAAATATVIHRLDLLYTDIHLTTGIPVVCTNGALGMTVMKGTVEANGDNLIAKGEEKVGINSAIEQSNPMLDGRLKLQKMFHYPVSISLTTKTLALAKEMGCVTNYYIDHDIYAQPLVDWHFKATQKYSDLTGVIFKYCQDDYKEAISRGLPSKLLILCGEENIDSAYQQIAKHLDGDAKVIRGSPPFFVEILEKDVCKGNGLEQMCQSLNIPLEECISFGDGYNDIEFLQKSGIGYAMKNAPENVKCIADKVTEYCNNEDGVIRALIDLEQNERLHFEN